MGVFRLFSFNFVLGAIACIFSETCFKLMAVNAMEEDMKKLLIGMALGAAVGMVVSELPQVKQMLNRGKKKVKELSK